VADGVGLTGRDGEGEVGEALGEATDEGLGVGEAGTAVDPEHAERSNNAPEAMPRHMHG